VSSEKAFLGGEVGSSGGEEASLYDPDEVLDSRKEKKGGRRQRPIFTLS